MPYKYPYIPDKNMYAAVMYACKYIRETGYFNKAVEYAAEKYGVSEEKLKQYIRARQAAGQKGKAKGRKYRYYILQAVYETEANGINYSDDYSIIRASNSFNAETHYAESDEKRTMRNDYGGAFSIDFNHIIVGDKNGYTTKQEAQEALKKIRQTDEHYDETY